MQLDLYYDAMIRLDHSGLSVIFTDDGAKQVTDERYDAFDTACGQKIRKEVSDVGLTIKGYQCVDPEEPLLSMWALAELTKEHFDIQVGLIVPG